MEKIKIHNNKRLKLINVITKELRNVSSDNLNNEIRKFINLLEVSNVQTRGPLITKTIGTHFRNDQLLFDYDIMVQLEKPTKLKKFKVLDNITLENCLYVHYEGIQEDFSYVQTKLELYIWENDLITTGEEITIHLESINDMMIADVFRPVERFS